MSKAKKDRYKKVGDHRLIEIRVKTAPQLFDNRDPAPFWERDLSDDFVDYISSAAKEIPLKSSLKIVIHIDAPETSDLTRDNIIEAIKSQTAYQTELQERSLHDHVRRGQWVLLLGAVILAVCLGLATTIADEPPPTRLLTMAKEGLIIVGWVSIWRPVEVLLYDWWPIYDRLRLLRKLLNTEIEIHFGK